MRSDTTVVVMRIPTALKEEFRAFAHGNERTLSQEMRNLMTRELAKVAQTKAPRQ